MIWLIKFIDINNKSQSGKYIRLVKRQGDQVNIDRDYTKIKLVENLFVLYLYPNLYEAYVSTYK
jgi:hypothetical protein